MSDQDSEYKILGQYKVVKRAGSYQITLPPELMHLLEAGNGDTFGFYVNKNSGQIFVGKVKSVKIKTAGKDRDILIESK
jgi:bifunctional DNA-binding transcriptional regulator/antitoxin component of YhaV-PrlF toxin-antitoxin module